MADEAFVSLVTNDSYANGALVLGYSLRRANTTRKLALLVSSFVSQPMRQHLSRVWDHLEVVDLLDSGDETNLALLTRPELGITFTKLHAWNLTQYSKCVFLDADTMVLQNVDELFSHDELSAVPDVGWPDCFNSGVFVFQPSRTTYEALLQYAIQNGSFDGGDQGLLNSYFSNWNRLSFVYNMNSSASYSYAPAFRQFGHNVKIVHFLGPLKPWHFSYNHETGEVNMPNQNGGIIHERTFLQQWWDIYNSCVCPTRHSHSDNSEYHQTHSESTTHSHTDDNAEHHQTHSEGPTYSHTVNDAEQTNTHTPITTTMTHEETQSTSVIDNSTAAEDSDERQDPEIVTDQNSVQQDIHQVTDEFSYMQLGDPPDEAGMTPEDRDCAHRRAWECGRIDYMGIDSFNHIQEWINQFVR